MSNTLNFIKRKYVVNLAEQLFNSQTLGGTNNNIYKLQVNKILKQCTPPKEKYPEKQQVLLKCINLIGEPKTPKERYLVAISYAWSRTQYREFAIKYLNLYLNNNLYVEIYSHRNYKINGKSTLEENKKHHLVEMYNYLGKSYIGIYDFENALNSYEKAINIMPQNPVGYFGKTEVLVKQNKLQECQYWLLECQKSPYYKLDKNKLITDPKNWFYKSINDLLDNINHKIEKGYIYKPRIKK